jgi:glycosyltransferase involved in cell wall biosynthesis
MGTGAPALAALETMGCDPEKLCSLPYFVDLDAITPHVSPGGPSIAYVSCGRLHADKGYDLALRALALVHAPSHAFTYTIAGVGPDRPRLERLAEDLGIASRVRFLGWLEPAAIAEFYQSGAVFLHPARREPYGVAVLEAMAAGLAVIASDASVAAVDRITDGVNGFLHPCNNEQALASAIRRAIGDRGALARVSAEARVTAERWPVSKAVTIVRGVLPVTAV